MKYSTKVNVKGKTYHISFTPATGRVNCVNCGTLRSITSGRTLATIFAAWADQDHAEALEMNARHSAQLAREVMYFDDHRSLFVKCDPYVQGLMVEDAHAEALKMDKAFETESAIKKFSAIAPYIIGNVMARLNGDESEEQSLTIIHEEILHYFEAHRNMTMQYLAFNEDQRKVFAEMMYDIHKEKGVKAAPRLNPVYEKFVKETGKTGSLDFICHKLSGADENSCNIYQRTDGMQIAVDQLGTTKFMRPFKQAKWLRAGFEANLEYFWMVESGVKITPEPDQIASYDNGFLSVEELDE